jgi:hypothetical protein
LRELSARPSRARTVGATRTRTAEVEVLDHARDHRDLLRVLLPEPQLIGLDHVQELGHDRRDAGEVPGPMRALEHAVEPADDARAWPSR